MNQSVIIGVGALLLGGVGGFVVGNAGGGSGTPAEGAESGEAKIRRTTGLAAGGGSGEARTGSRERSLEAALREPGQMARIESLIDLYSSMDAAQLESEAGRLETLPMSERMLASILLFGRWGEIDPYGALAHTEAMGFGGMFARPTVLQSWASVDPVNAAKHFEENPDDFRMMGGPGRGRGGQSAAGVVAAEWAKVDPQAAMNWATGLEGGDMSSAVRAVAREMAISDPEAAIAAVASLPADELEGAYAEIAEQWAAKDFSAAESWISSLNGEERDRAMSEALDVLASTDPQSAATKVSSISAGRDRDRAIEDVAGKWASQDPAAAAAWVVTQETGDMDDAMREVMSRWAGSDSSGALAFIQSQPMGEARDSATSTYLWTNRDTEPAQAIELAETISDDRSRDRTVGMTAMRWMREDEAAARAYIESSTALSDGARERILSGDWGRRGGRGQRGR